MNARSLCLIKMCLTLDGPTLNYKQMSQFQKSRNAEQYFEN